MSISHLAANNPEIPVSNVIQEVQVLFETGCTYKKTWYARKFTIERFSNHRTSSPPNYVFKFLFWCFSPCIDGFQYCQPVISVDGTHLRGSYKGVLLIISTWDANNHFRLKVGVGSSNIYENMLSKIGMYAGTKSKQWKFDRVMSKIQDRNVDAYIYLEKIDLEKWTLLHDGEHKHGITTTNIS
ncbi:hypothetical protein M9H77_31451 [Catharanthus roseus]|uniref:Uncharacterized protein n=1 Tax=Catharanthus roseus TaxID=4058 RepID=A0ACC0A0G1_CATRO|nr:hypothetical protein M9H77_31451 [Catharanthus roseus]